MDWTLAIHRNRDALLRVVAMLFAAAGLVRGAQTATLPRPVRMMVLRLLRPAESAVRRLDVIVRREMSLPPPVLRAAPKAGSIPKGSGDRAPSFSLIEPLQRTSFAPRVRRHAGPGPRIFLFDGTDPPYTVEQPPAAPSPDDRVDAKSLCRRLLALQRALDDLPRQARRLARWQEKRKRSARRGRTRPLRPGRPPGHRKRPVHIVDTLLAECHTLALMALAPPDTT